MLFKDRHLIRVAVVMWGSVRRITAAPTGRQLSSGQATQDTGLYYTEYTVLCSECTGRVMTRMCCSHLCSQRLSLMWRLRADRWSSRQHRTSSDMICLTQLFRDACQDAFRSRSHVKPAESLESRPSANLPVLTLNIVQYDEFSHRFTTKVLRNLWKMCCWLLSEADDSVRLVPAAGAPTVHPSVNCLINQHLTW